MKNCAVAEWGLGVRAMAIVPTSFFNPALKARPASFSMGARFAFWRMSAIEAAALDHESIDDAVEYRPVVGPVVGVPNEVGDCLGRIFRIEFKDEDFLRWS